LIRGPPFVAGKLPLVFSGETVSPFIERWVSPFCLQILHGNYALRLLVGDELAEFNADVGCQES
jgi:hypothetical protein